MTASTFSAPPSPRRAAVRVLRDAPCLDRAAGAVLGSAAGDALGAGYEFAAPPAAGTAAMIGGGLGNFAPGEWTDDTAQAVAILRAAAAGMDLRTPQAHDMVARGWLGWYDEGPADIGMHTAAVFGASRRVIVPDEVRGLAAAVRAAAQARYEATGRAGSNGALMRTGPVALAHLDDPDGCAQAAAAIAALTHPDPLAAEACVIWSEGVRRAVLDGTFDGVRAGVALLPTDRAAFWSAKLDEAENRAPGSHGDNGFVVVTLQDAWSAITRTDGTDAGHLAAAVDAAVGAGHDTDTVAAVAGALLGARWGASAVPHAWRRMVHGWPGLSGSDLVGLAVKAVRGGSDDANGWPSARSLLAHYTENWVVRPEPVPHPDDPGLLVGTSGTLRLLMPGGSLHGQVDAVVSLCRVGVDDVPAGVERVEVWLVDSAEESANPNLTWVLDDTVAALRELREAGKRVLLHCVAAESRTPTVAGLYGAAVTGDPPLVALARVREVVPQAAPKAAFVKLLADRSG